MDRWTGTGWLEGRWLDGWMNDGQMDSWGDRGHGRTRGSEEFHPGDGTLRNELARDGAGMGQNYGGEARQEGSQVEAQNALTTYALSMFWGMNEKAWPEGVMRAAEGKGQ